MGRILLSVQCCFLYGVANCVAVPSASSPSPATESLVFVSSNDSSLLITLGFCYVFKTASGEGGQSLKISLRFCLSQFISISLSFLLLSPYFVSDDKYQSESSYQ